MLPLKRKKRCYRSMSPAQAKTVDDLCRLGRDNYTRGHFWILVHDSTVTVAAQKAGESATTMANFPKKEFTQLIRWYLRPQRMKPARAQKLRLRK